MGHCLSMLMQPIEVLLQVTDVLEALGITYCVGGARASSAYGEPRANRDAQPAAALSYYSGFHAAVKKC